MSSHVIATRERGFQGHTWHTNEMAIIASKTNCTTSMTDGRRYTCSRAKPSGPAPPGPRPRVGEYGAFNLPVPGLKYYSTELSTPPRWNVQMLLN
ncbi:hypothetical protein EVAR_70993_1 [Eumeta japonica]|uniref:Uncharacterized protein n=1 Tax=Eumeta variegata TaxID=151549 RepID=A0A4C2AA74_EUMVA|nr:hypothetical protein EVAR_70993_1 [Eumeta japonica]